MIAGMRTSGVLNAQSRLAAACSYFKAENPRGSATPKSLRAQDAPVANGHTQR